MGAARTVRYRYVQRSMLGFSAEKNVDGRATYTSFAFGRNRRASMRQFAHIQTSLTYIPSGRQPNLRLGAPSAGLGESADSTTSGNPAPACQDLIKHLITIRSKLHYTATAQHLMHQTCCYSILFLQTDCTLTIGAKYYITWCTRL